MRKVVVPKHTEQALAEDMIGVMSSEIGSRKKTPRLPEVDPSVLRTVDDIIAARVDPSGPNTLVAALTDDELRARMLSEFKSEPIDDYLTELIKDGIHLNVREALNVDLTEYTKLDDLYRWVNNGDAAVNFVGRPNKGKSNCMLDKILNWCRITRHNLDLSNIAYLVPTFNLLLKGYKIVPAQDDHVNLVEYSMDRGNFVALDEGSDYTVAGMGSATMVSQTTDIEARMRGLQVGRFCSGTRRMLHQSYYDVRVIERDPREKICTGLVYATETNDPTSPVYYLGSVRVPYVPLKLFESYYKPKMDSIRGYSRAQGTNIIAKLLQCFAEELRANKEYQSLPTKPPAMRLNWLQAHNKYAIFQTVGYFNQLEQLSRPIKQPSDSRSPMAAASSPGTRSASTSSRQR